MPRGIVDDPSDYVYSGHREVIGRCQPHVINLQSVLLGYGGEGPVEGVNGYHDWIRAVAEARWKATDLSDLPWWSPAHHVDEIATAEQHPEVQTFDGQRLAEERAEFELSDFVDRFESVSGVDIDELVSRHRSVRHITGRIEFCSLAVSRYRLRACDIAALLGKGRNSVTRWLSQGLSRERDNPEFAARLDALDTAISRR